MCIFAEHTALPYTILSSMAEALLAQEHHDYLMQIREMELLQLDELHHGPAVAEDRGGGAGSGSGGGEDRGGGVSINTGGEGEGNGGASGGAGNDVESAGVGRAVGAVGDEPAVGGKKVFSFANITQVRHRCILLLLRCVAL